MREESSIENTKFFEAEQPSATNNRYEKQSIFEVSQPKPTNLIQSIAKMTSTISAILLSQNHINKQKKELYRYLVDAFRKLSIQNENIVSLLKDQDNRQKKRIEELERVAKRHEKEIMYMTKAWFSPRKSWWKRIFKS